MQRGRLLGHCSCAPALAALVALASAGPGTARERDAPPREFRVSLSVSPFTEQLLRAGVVFSDGKLTAKSAEALQRLFQAHGANEVYARIATTRAFRPGNGDHSVTRGLERAALAKALGLPFNPELGLFGAYADITGQPPPDFRDYPQLKVPGEWTSLTLAQMLPVLRGYGAAVAQQILKTGVRVRIWDLGNEVEFGTAGVAVRPIAPQAFAPTEGKADWYRPPDAVDPAIGKMSGLELARLPEAERIAWLRAHLWPHLAKIFAAVAEGIRSVDRTARFSTHVSGMTATQPEQTVAFYRSMRDGGFLPDELGFSYYPTSSAVPPDRLKAFKETATRVQRELNRPIFVAEFGYPSGKMTGVFSWNAAVDRYPQTPEGQAAFLRDLVAWGASTGVLSGIRPWAPELAVPGWEPMSLFALAGKSATGRPGLDAIREGLRQR
jgi:arabinogalactan endo-1,4-beta-galactosidase